MMNQKLKIRDPCKDDGDKFGKAFCLSIIHTGLNKCLSNEAILENYGTAMRGMKEYHKLSILQQLHPSAMLLLHLQLR